jgi:hypothetical protein
MTKTRTKLRSCEALTTLNVKTIEIRDVAEMGGNVAVR